MRKPRARLIILATVLAGLVLFVARQPEAIGRLFVAGLSDDYAEAPAGPVQAQFDGATPSGEQIQVDLKKIAEGIPQPTDIQFPPGVPGYAVVLQKQGEARWLKLDSGVHGPLLRLDVLTASEQGLLGLAFHPRFAENGRFFINYVTEGEKGHESRVAEWKLQGASDLKRAKAEPVKVLMRVRQPYQNHNAGQLAFGPDGYLYVGWGDGGLRDDPKGSGQNTATMLGAMLRIDVDRPGEGERAYAIPPDNPFVGKEGFLPELWAYGLRNPWRYGFDPKGRLVVADVGQDTWEEIDLVQAGDNLGWNVREGFSCFRDDPKECERDDLVDPIHVYGRDRGNSITGGHVYTGKALPALSGKYVFGDFVSGRLFALELPDDRTQRVDDARHLGKWPVMISTFGQDPDGELYVGAYARGEIYKLVAPQQ